MEVEFAFAEFYPCRDEHNVAELPPGWKNHAGFRRNEDAFYRNAATAAASGTENHEKKRSEETQNTAR